MCMGTRWPTVHVMTYQWMVVLDSNIQVFNAGLFWMSVHEASYSERKKRGATEGQPVMTKEVPSSQSSPAKRASQKTHRHTYRGRKRKQRKEGRREGRKGEKESATRVRHSSGQAQALSTRLILFKANNRKRPRWHSTVCLDPRMTKKHFPLCLGRVHIDPGKLALRRVSTWIA